VSDPVQEEAQMSRRTNLDAVVDEMLSELESELESESFAADAGASSCSGWESDRDSFSIRAAQTFCKDAFNVSVSTPDTVKCSGQSCVVRYSAPGGWPTFNITVDLSRVPGVVTVSGTADPLAMRSKSCSYTYSCDGTGNINFKRSGDCKTI
jgi:hypothetical protein